MHEIHDIIDKSVKDLASIKEQFGYDNDLWHTISIFFDKVPITIIVYVMSKDFVELFLSIDFNNAEEYSFYNKLFYEFTGVRRFTAEQLLNYLQEIKKQII